MSGLNTGNLGSGQYMATYENNPGEWYYVHWEEEGTLCMCVCVQGNKSISLSVNIFLQDINLYVRLCVCASLCLCVCVSVCVCVCVRGLVLIGPSLCYVA